MSILSEEANKKSLPSLNSLLENPWVIRGSLYFVYIRLWFFSRVFTTWFDIGSNEKSFKISVKLKNALAAFKNQFEQNLHAEQAEVWAFVLFRVLCSFNF